MAELPPDDFSLVDLIRNPDAVRDALRFIHQLKRVKIITQDGREIPLLYSHKSENSMFDLRDPPATATVIPRVAPVLTVTADDANQELDCEWTLPNETSSAVFLERGTDGITFAPLVELAGTVTTYSDTDVTQGTTYYYRVRDYNEGEYSPWSNIESGMLAVPTGFALYAWGTNFYKQYGNGTSTSVSTPAQIGTDETWVMMAGGEQHAAAVKSDGTLWTTGKNDWGQLGQGDTTQRTSWTQVGAGTTWTHVQCGHFFTVARKSDGTLWATGQNQDGQLGRGTVTTYETSFAQVGSDTDWTAAFACGYVHALAIKTAGTLYAWGQGTIGQLGQGALDENDHNSPVQIGSATNWVQVSGGEQHTFAINSSDEMWCCGQNSDAQLGIGTSTGYQNELQHISGTWAKVACGQSHTIAITTSGTIYGTGKNSSGQLGLGDTTERTSFTQIGSGTDWDTVSCGTESTMATKTGGTIWGWGSNWDGNIGIGNTTSPQSSPVQEVTTATDWDSVFACYYCTFGLKVP